MIRCHICGIVATNNNPCRLFPGAKCVRYDRISIHLIKGYVAARFQRLQCRELELNYPWHVPVFITNLYFEMSSVSNINIVNQPIVGISREGNRFMISCDKAVCGAVLIRGPIYQHVLTLIPEWISNHIKSKLCDEIIDPFLDFDGYAVGVCEWISNVFPYFIMNMITYPCRI